MFVKNKNLTRVEALSPESTRQPPKFIQQVAFPENSAAKTIRRILLESWIPNHMFSSL